jgi:hypothetical protein
MRMHEKGKYAKSDIMLYRPQTSAAEEQSPGESATLLRTP